MKQALASILIIVLELMSLPIVPAFAQDASLSAQEAASAAQTASTSAAPTLSYATASATLIPLITAAQNPFAETAPPEPPEHPASQTLLQLLGPSFSTGQVEQLTLPATMKQPAKVMPLPKKIFKANEPIALTITNAKAEELHVRVIDPLGKEMDQESIEESSLADQTILSLKPSRIGFRPGNYTIHITDATGKTTTQNFTWGVLAINTNRSMYTPEQTATIAMSVLDERGTMVCDAQVRLEITDPGGTTTKLATGEKTITVNPQCLSHNFSLTPDYEATYQVHKTGQYTLSLSATTKNGTNTITDSFSVADAVPIDVERVSATRLYPVYSYPMLFHITAHQDFSGTILETAPPNFTITPDATGSSQPYTSSRLLMPVTDMQHQFGVSSLALATPFRGDYALTQGFGQALTDPKEKAFYALFGLAGHDGLDFALPMETAVLATDDGTVSQAGDGAYGTTVVIDHAWGKSYYGHLSNTAVTVGQRVIKGQEIGLSGNTGQSTGPHLHFGIKPKNPTMQNGFYGKVDPAPYLALSLPPATVPAVWTTSSVKNANKVITWTVSLKNGESIDLGYSYKAPGLSPQLYAFGPLTFNSGNQTVFQEARLWQVAVDGNSTAGPNNCGTGADNNSIGTIAWASPQNACSSGNASATFNSTTSSHYLKVTNFGFTSGQIPTGSKIIGIQFTVTKLGTGSCIKDNAVRDVKGGTIDGSNDHSSASFWQQVATPITYGSTSDLWGQTWTASDITSSTFGMAISSKATPVSTCASFVSAFVTATITYNASPNAPSQDAPANNATNACTTPVFKMTATDPESDNVQYKVTIYSNSGCTTVVQTNDETSSQTGWSGQNATCVSGTDCYTSGTQATFTTQTALSTSTQYWWKASAIDPLGSNSFTDSTTCNTFTTGPTLDALMRHGKWFCSDGVKQPFTF